MTPAQQNKAILNLLINTQSQIYSLRDFIIVFICDQKRKDRGPIIKLFNQITDDYKNVIKSKITDPDSRFDVDDLLNDIL